ncbi:MAG: protein kinase [Burkholderiales bacterium]|nr:protein kinase [Burkholderiales bacterium]
MVDTVTPEDRSAISWQRVEAALDLLLALPANEREAATQRIADGDAALATELRSLLAHMATGDSLLDRPAAELLSTTALPDSGLAPGTRLGPWAVVGPIGRGGMGHVYRGRRADGQFEQDVAIKLARADSIAAWQRFPLERQIVARLDHPGIARLIDGGIADGGQPYMVMELVSGQEITTWCDSHGASLARRLALFQSVCDAVAYAHRHLVLHRDIKPSNVMVTDDERVKLLDFGIARLLDAAGSATTAELVLTPAYCAPEQLSGQALSTATDVYALGLLLHELLTGASAQRVSGLPMAAAIHAVLHTQPRPPSGVARQRADAPVPARQLEGDLDAIVAKALRKEPDQRYPTVDALAADLARYRGHQPVLARRGNWAYAAGRAMRRHRGVAAAAAVALLSIAGGTGAVAWQARQARAEADRANAVKAFLVQIFRASTPATSKGRDVTAKELLALGSQRIEGALRDQPLAMAQLDDELGDIYNEMDDNPHALPHLDRAVATYERLGLLDSRDGLSALFHRGNVRLDSGHMDDARVDLERCLRLGDARFGPRNRFAVAVREKLAFLELELGHYDRALQIAREGLALPVGEDPAWDALRRLRLLSVMGQTLTTMGRYPEAEATFGRLLSDAAKAPGFSAPDLMVARLQLARNYHYDGNEEEALRQTRALVPDMEHVLGPHHLITRVGRQVMSQALTAIGRYDEAIAVQRANLEGLPESGLATANELASLAVNERKAGRFDEARAAAARALAILESPDAEPRRRETVRRTLGEAELGLGHVDAGTTLIETARDHGKDIKGYAQSSDEGSTLESLAVARRLGGDWDGAQDLLNQACLVHRHATRADSALVRRCEAQQQWVQAMRAPASDPARQAFADAATRYAAILPADHVARSDLQLMQALLDERSHRAGNVDRPAALRAWQHALHQPWPGRLVFIH